MKTFYYEWNTVKYAFLKKFFKKVIRKINKVVVYPLQFSLQYVSLDSMTKFGSLMRVELSYYRIYNYFWVHSVPFVYLIIYALPYINAPHLQPNSVEYSQQIYANNNTTNGSIVVYLPLMDRHNQ